jgi:hypothetical protein
MWKLPPSKRAAEDVLCIALALRDSAVLVPSTIEEEEDINISENKS